MTITLPHLLTCAAKIRECQKALGRDLSTGEMSDLLLDTFAWLPSSIEAHQIIEQIGRKNI